MLASTSPRLNTRSIVVLGIATLLTGALLVLFFVRLSSAGRIGATLGASPLVGRTAPAFAITPWDTASGEPVALGDFAGHPVVVNFWGSWCAECAEEQPVLQAAWQKYQAQGVHFVGIAFQDHQPQGAAYLKQYAVTYPAGPATSAQAAVDYGVTGAPETVFIGRDGRIVTKFIGPIPDTTLDQTIQSLLRG